MKSLKTLIVNSNSINKIDPIDGLNNLQYLDLSKNKLRILDKSNIGNLPSLKALLLDSNYLKSLSFACRLPKLTYFSVQSNKLTELSSIDKINELELLEDLFLLGNPIAKNNQYRLSVFRRNPKILRIDNQVSC